MKRLMLFLLVLTTLVVAKGYCDQDDDSGFDGSPVSILD